MKPTDSLLTQRRAVPGLPGEPSADTGPTPVFSGETAPTTGAGGAATDPRQCWSQRARPMLRPWGQRLLVYGLLVGGSLVFAWPFLWMMSTSVKTDREMATGELRFWPIAPAVPVRSPFVDRHAFDDLPAVAHRAELLRVIADKLGTLDFPWTAAGLNRDDAVGQTARGIFERLTLTLPRELWKQPLPALSAEIARRVDVPLVQETEPRFRRAFLLGQLRARSYDLHEDTLVAPENAAAAWKLGDVNAASLQPANDAGRPCAEWRYDFSRRGKITVSQTFTTSFPVARLHRLQLYSRPDDSWHAVDVRVEKLGVRLRSERATDLANFTWGVSTWQEPGPDDATNKIRTWTLLREEARGAGIESDPHRLKVSITLRQRGWAAGWWAKIALNYHRTLDHVPFIRYAATSLFLVILNIIGAVFSSSLVAYSFARLRWPGRGFCFALLLATMMIPGQVTMIPQFLIMQKLGWYNTLVPLWIGSFFASAFNVFLLRQFLKGIPRDLEDAARIDGCGFWRVYWHIMLPLVRPTLAAIAIFTFLGAWNDFMGPLLYLSDQRLYPLSFGLFALNVQAGANNTGMMMAGSLLMTLPVIVIFLFAQRYFLQGITLTGVKG